jgi:protein TonB
MEPEGVSRKGSGSLRGPLATSLLLHAALLGLLALGLPRAMPEPAASVEVRLVSSEFDEGAGGGEAGDIAAGPSTEAGRPLGRTTGLVSRTAGPRVREAGPAAAPPGPAALPGQSSEPPAGEPPAPPLTPMAPVPAVRPPSPLSASPPATSGGSRADAAGLPLAVEGPKTTAPDLSLGAPSDSETTPSSWVTEGALPGRGPAATGAAAPVGGGIGEPDGGGFIGQGDEGAGGPGGAFARAKDGGPGTGGGTGTGGLGAGTGRDGAFAYILRRIEATKRYPEEARRLGHRGTVAVRFRIGPDGAVAAAEVAASSGFSLLDAASLETVRRAAPLPAVPGWLRVRISYGLAETRP